MRRRRVRARLAAREEYELEFNDAPREFSGGGVTTLYQVTTRLRHKASVSSVA